MAKNRITHLNPGVRKPLDVHDFRLTNDDLHIIASALRENRPLLTALRIEMREKVFFDGATLKDIQHYQPLFDRNEVFNLLGDRYLLSEQQVIEGAEILAWWRSNPELIDDLSLEKTIQLLAELLGAHTPEDEEQAAMPA